MHPGDFIAGSKLAWAHDQACADETVEPDPDPVRLGGLHGVGYVHRASTGDRCRLIGSERYSGEYTRPNDGDHPARPASLEEDEGFYLDFDVRLSPKSLGSVPVWTEESTDGGALAVTYWLFYGRSVPRIEGKASTAVSHEGDWEHINVRLDPVLLVPQHVGYFAHHEPEDIQGYLGSNVDRVDWLHPTVYAARTTHGSSWRSSTHENASCKAGVCLDDEYGDGGDRWQTWKSGAEGVIDVHDMPGYGFGGAWGAAGQIGDTTGPSGPSSYKNPLAAG